MNRKSAIFIGTIVSFGLALPQLVMSAVKTKSLVAGYRFEETSGSTSADISGNAFTGTATGTTIVTGHNGRGRSFNGTSDKIAVADNVALRLSSAFTVATWVKLGALPASGKTAIVAEKDDAVGNANYVIGVSNNDGSWCTGSAAWYTGFQSSAAVTYQACYAPTINTGTWYHLVSTWDSTNLKLYLNGVLQVTTNYATRIPTTGTGVLMFGNEAGNTFWFNGTIDEARIYSRALTAAEIRALMLGYEPSEF
jgi:hypothetical protein